MKTFDFLYLILNNALIMNVSLLKRITIFFFLLVTSLLFYNFQTFHKTRIIKVGIVTYGGYVPGLYYNGGLKVSEDSKFYKKHRLLVEFKIVDDYVASRQMFEKGELDLIWMNFDSYSTEANQLAKKYNAKIVFTSSKSNGADVIVATRKVEKPSDLIGKTISVSEMTPSHSFLLAYLEKHGISINQVNLRTYPSAIEAAAAFKAKQVDAAVVWSPDDEDCVNSVSGARILTTTKDFPNAIIDGFIAKEEFINKNGKALMKLFKGWTNAATFINEDKTAKQEAAKILQQAFVGLSYDLVYLAIENVHLCDLDDNKMIFGLRPTKKGEVSGKEVYQSFTKKYLDLGYLEDKSAMKWEEVSDSRIIQFIQ